MYSPLQRVQTFVMLSIPDFRLYADLQLLEQNLLCPLHIAMNVFPQYSHENSFCSHNFSFSL